MFDIEFLASVEEEFARRMKLFRQWTSIVPSANSDRKGLSWYINKRNRPRIADYQHVRELSTDEVGSENYVDWVAKNNLVCEGTDEQTENNLESVRANPDLLSEAANVCHVQASYSEQQINAAKDILDHLEDLLTDNEYTVFNLFHKQGLGVGEIADIRGVSHVAVIKMLKRIQGKLKKVYAKKRITEVGQETINEY